MLWDKVLLNLVWVGVAIFLMAHLFVNIGMNIGIMPITGTTLPFLSYGDAYAYCFYGIGNIDGYAPIFSPHPSRRPETEFLGPR